jgi:hypothetical protein
MRPLAGRGRPGVQRGVEDGLAGEDRGQQLPGWIRERVVQATTQCPALVRNQTQSRAGVLAAEQRRHSRGRPGQLVGQVLDGEGPAPATAWRTSCCREDSSVMSPRAGELGPLAGGIPTPAIAPTPGSRTGSGAGRTPAWITSQSIVRDQPGVADRRDAGGRSDRLDPGTCSCMGA